MTKKITITSLIVFLLSVTGFNKVLAQTTIVNYDFNSGSSYATLAPTLASNISCTVSSTEAYSTSAGIASSGAFTNNSSAGDALTMASSEGTNTKYFTFTTSGSALVNYTAFKVYFQSRRSNTGASTLTLQYSLNGGTYTSFTSNTMSPGNGSFTAATFTLPVAVNNPTTSIAFRILASGGTSGGTLRVDNFQVQAVLAAASSPTVSILGQDPNTPSAVNWALGSLTNQFYWASLSPTGGNATLSSVTANMSGSYLASDIAANGLKLYYSSDATLVPTGDVLLKSQSSSKSGATETITWSAFTQTIATGATGYIYATADVTTTATVGATLAGSFTSDANIVFTPTVSYGGSNSYGAVTNKTFAALPTNPSTFNINCSSEAKVSINMNAPVTGTVLVFANTSGSFVDPTGAGSSFTGANSTFTLATNYPAVGGRLVYSGPGANFSVSGLSIGQNYSFKAYSYSGSTWSSGTSVINGTATTQPVSGVVVTPTSGQLTLSWSNPGATSCYNNVIIIARQGSAVESAVSKSNFDGLLSDADFTGANAVWTSNSSANDVNALTAGLIGTASTNFLVYKGTGSFVNITGLTNGTPYYFRIFTVDGSSSAKWSAATDVNGIPSLPGYYWNGGSVSALPANGGTGTWGTTNAWRQPSASGSQATWANNNPAIFAGTAGLVTLDGDKTATSYLFNTSSYTIQTTSTTIYDLSGPIVLAANNELVLAPNKPSTAAGSIEVETINGSGTASVTILANQSSSAAARINVIAPNGSVNVPTGIVSTSGTGVAGYVATNSGVTINGNIINNSTMATCIGATSGNDITVNGVISGTAPLRLAAGINGGAGLVYLNNSNTYSGGTQFNATISSTVTLNTNNALPSTGDVIMAYGAGNGGTLDLNGYNHTIGNLTNTDINNSTIINSSAASNSTLTVTQTTAQTFGLNIKDGSSRKIALVKNGSAVWTLSNSGHTFSGGLTLNAGELRFNPSGSLTSLSVCPVALNGGTLGTTGISTGRILKFSTLNLKDNSNIILNTSGTHTITFAASNAQTWTTSKTLIITGWQGVYTSATGSSGTAGKIIVGSNATALTSAQLAQIKFFNGTTNYDAMLLANGELVPYLAQVTTQLRTSYCGYMAESFGEFIGADSVLTANHYEFKLVNAATSYTQTFLNSSGYPYLTLYTIPGISYNTNYTVTVRWSADGVSWSPYGSPCAITSPTAEVTELDPAYCGYTVTSYPEVIYANAVSGATQYEYKLVNVPLGYSQTFVKTNNNFNLAQFTGLTNGTTYSVSVRVYIFGAWDIYGTTCSLTTPIVVPTTSLQSSSCGITVSSYPQVLFAEPVSAATQYEYKLVNTALSYSQSFAKTNNNFNLAQFTGLTNGTTYSVSVRVNVNNTWGNYGPVCNVTTPSSVPTTSLQSSSCGITTSSYPQVLFAEPVSAATQYEYKLENAGLSYSQSFAKTNNNFNLAQFTGLTNGTTYSVSVRVNVNNTWGNYGPVCNVTTPSSIPTTSLQASNCGITASSYSQVLFAESVSAATQYEYKLENAGLSYSQSFVKTNNNFNLTQFTGLTNGATYSVSVRINVNNTWGNYGPVCSITAPAASPTTSLQASSCGITASAYNQVLFAVAVTGATQYEYRLMNGSLSYTQSYAKSNNNFNLTQFTGLANSTTYTVQVRVYYDGAWGAYGPACTVTSPASAIILAGGNGTTNSNSPAYRFDNTTGLDNAAIATTFNAIAYPNPFNESFNVSLLSYQVNEPVTIRVYDGMGKLVEDHTVMPSSVNGLIIGADYAKGLYNIIVSQSGSSKAMKVVRQ